MISEMDIIPGKDNIDEKKLVERKCGISDLPEKLL